MCGRMLTSSPAIFASYLYIKLFHPTSVTSSSKSSLWAPPRAKNTAKPIILATSRSKARFCHLNSFAYQPQCIHHAQITKSFVFHCKTNNSWWSRHLICIENPTQNEVRSRSGWSRPCVLGSKIHSVDLFRVQKI